MRTLGMISLLALVSGCNQAKQGFDDGFNTKFHENFVKSCVSSAVQSGGAQDLATKLCTCASNKVKERYTVKQKMTLKDEQLLPIVAECKKEAGV